MGGAEFWLREACFVEGTITGELLKVVISAPSCLQCARLLVRGGVFSKETCNTHTCIILGRVSYVTGDCDVVFSLSVHALLAGIGT